MTEKRPHLRIEQPIEQTTRVYEGGGGGTYPRTSYETHARKIYGEAQQLRAIFANLQDARSTDHRYFKVVVPVAKPMSTSTGGTLMEDLHAKLVGSPSSDIGHVSTTSASLELLMDELQRYAAPGNIGKSKFAVLEEVGAIPFREKVSASALAALTSKKGDAPVDMLLSVFPDLSSVERRAILQSIGEWLRSKNGSVTSITEVESGTYVRVLASAAVVQEVAESFMSVQSVDPVEYTLELSSRPGPSLPSAIEVLPNSSSAIAAIIDSGVVTGSRFIDASIVARENPVGTPFNEDHGTFVASRIIYGDSLRDQVAAGRLTPDVKVMSVCTITGDEIGNKKPASTIEMMKIVRDTVARWHTQIRVYNISQNLFPADGRDPTITDVVNPFAAELDRLARRYNVLFVLTAGNYPEPGGLPPTKPYPEHFADPLARIVPPAEAVLALTVGSLAARANSASLAPQGQPSPFTRKGPGFAKFRKPDVVAHGGNYGALWQQTDDLATAGIGSHGDFLCYGSGTSFAAPVITRLAAKLFELVPDATPELIRALLIHFSALPFSSSVPELHHLMGNGHPDAVRLLSSTQWSQAFVHIGMLPYREIRRVGFYVPEALCSRKGNRRVRVRVTLAYAPETNRNLKSGYCKSHVRCKLAKLGPDGQIKEINASEGKAVVKTRYAGLTRLEKTFSANIAGGEWMLLMEHESRWSLKDEGMPIAVVITVEDPREDPKADIFAMIQNEVPTKYAAQLAQPVPIRV